MKTLITIIFAKLVKIKNQKWILNPIQSQDKTFQKLIRTALRTSFGNEHDFSEIITYDDFKKKVPVRDYEGFKPYVDKVVLHKSCKTLYIFTFNNCDVVGTLSNN